MSDTVVQLFVTCLVNSFHPQVGEAAVEILERLGVVVEFPADQTCCGQPALNAGYPAEAKAMARQTVDVLDSTAGPIVVPSGSCAQMIIDHAPGLVADDLALHAKAVRVSGRTRELTQYLVDDLGLTDLGTKGAGTVAFHPSCHGLRGLGLTDQAERLLDGVGGLERTELPDATECCGFGGLFSIEMPEVSAAILETKIANIEASGADVIVGGDVGCLMHIGGGLRRRGVPIEVLHIAEVLEPTERS